MQRHTDQTNRPFFGPCIWKTIHISTISYDPTSEESRSNMLAFLKSVATILPCKVCSEHYKEMLAKYPPTNYLSSNERLFLWSYIIHDLVNKRLHKRSPKFLEVKKYYFDHLGYKCLSCTV